MTRIFDSKRIINTSIGILALFIFALASHLAWDGYRKQAAGHRIVRTNAMADRIIEAAGIEAVERGMTAAGLASKRRVDAGMRQKIRGLRDQGDARWREALATAREIAQMLPPAAGFHAVLTQAVAAHAALAAARERVDETLARRRRAIEAREWFDISSRFIANTSLLRETAFTPADSPSEITQLNLTVKHRAWLMSEYAGMERGLLAIFISAEQPLPPEMLESLYAFRGVVDQNAGMFQIMKNLPDTDPRIRHAIEGMERGFLGRFNETRAAVYRGIRKGAYPMGGEAWLKSATDAIGSVLAVAAATSRVIEEKATQDAARGERIFVTQIALLLLTLGLAIGSILRVRKTADTLFHEKERAEVTLHSIGDAVITTDADARIEYLNPIAETLTGWTITEAKGRALKEVFHIVSGLTREPLTNPVERCLREARIVGLENNTVLMSRNGIERAIEDSAAPVRNRQGDIVGAVMVFYDVTLMRNAPHLLSHHATHDALTGLVNRREFERRLTELVERAKVRDEQHVLCYLDLDQFKLVNDTCGHIAGDKLLRQLSFLLKNRVRDTDTLARLGGDEFGVLIDSCHLEPAQRLADDIVRVVNEFRFVWEGTTFEIGVSIGMVPITRECGSPVEVLSQADAACYAAKDKGRNRVQLYAHEDAELQRRQNEMHWVSRIRKALEEDRFTLHCQAIVPVQATHAPRRYCEALVRMLDESGAIVPPTAFIPAAERYNLMPAIDRWVIRRALGALDRSGGGDPACASHADRREGARMCFINLSATSLADKQMAEFIRAEIEARGGPAQSLCFEITETAAVAHLDSAIAFMRQLKELGCRFALDDFGSGMSSFAYLKNLPVDYLKIDGTIVQNIADNQTDYTMVDAINRVGQVMGIKTIAEYVETDAIHAKLKELGVDYAQGFGIHRPCPIGEQLTE